MGHPIYISSSSSCRTISPDISDPISPSLTIVHWFWQFSRATSSICTELLYVCSSWTSCLCSSLWRGPQEYITYELVPTSPAVSRTSGSSILIVFLMGGRWPYSCCFVRFCLQLAAFFCNSHVFSLYVLVASTWCIHIAASILLLLGRNSASFYRSGLTSIRPIANR